MDQHEKAITFREMHIIGDPFVIPNAYDIGSAKMLTALGAKAIATTSSGFAFTLGRPDMGTISRDEMLDHCEDMVRAVGVPVSADLENGFVHDPDGVAETVALAAEAGLVGCTLEDSTMDSTQPSYDFDVAVARMAAAVEVAEELPFDFMVCARADGVMLGSYDVEEAIRRLQAYEEVGAHVVYCPLPPDMDDLKKICASVSIPVNVLCAGSFTKYSRDDFAKAGAARISIGGALARVTHRVVAEIGAEILGSGNFSSLSKAMPGDEVDQMLKTSGVS